MKKHKTRVPTREEFHREFAGVIQIEDFSTSYPSWRQPEHTRQELENLKKAQDAGKERL